MALPNIPSSYTKNYLPSKKIMIAGGIVFLAVILYFTIPKVIEYYQANRAAFSITGKPPEPLIASAGPQSTLDKDTDSDGIPDWQETLFGFDPKKADSDGDGTPDALPKSDGTSIGELINLSDLNKLTLAVYEKFQNVPSESITADQVQAATSAEVLAHAESVEKSFKKYGPLDLNLGESEPQNILDYSDTINNMLLSMGDPILLVKNIQQNILDGTDPKSEIAALNPIVTKLLATEVPAKISDVHLSLVNATYYLVQDLQLPSDGEELTAFTRSLIAQKNINLVQQSLADIATLQSVYGASSN